MLLVASGRSAAFPVLSGNEHFSYALTYGKGFCAVGAGTVDLDVRSTNHLGQAAFVLTLEIKASSIVEAVYHLVTRFTSVVTPDLHPLRYTKHAEEGRYIYDETADFAYSAEGECTVDVSHVVQGRPPRRGHSTRKDPVYDLVSVIFCARTLELSSRPKGEALSVSVATGVRVEEQSLVYDGVERVKTDEGKDVAAYVFALSRKTSKGGMTESARFWFSTDARRMPLRIDFNLKFGTLSAQLRTENARQ